EATKPITARAFVEMTTRGPQGSPPRSIERICRRKSALARCAIGSGKEKARGRAGFGRCRTKYPKKTRRRRCGLHCRVGFYCPTTVHVGYTTPLPADLA